jgi:hypothetical protein
MSLLSIPSGSDSSLEDMELCYERIQKDGIEQFYQNHPVECPTDRAGGSVSQPKEGSHEVGGCRSASHLYMGVRLSGGDFRRSLSSTVEYLFAVWSFATSLYPRVRPIHEPVIGVVSTLPPSTIYVTMSLDIPE